MKKYNKKEVREFLIESNAIEQVYDDVSLEQAIRAWEFLSTVDKMTPGVIKKLHKILMLRQDLAPHEKGFFRTVPVWVGGREGMNHLYIPETIDKWVFNANDLVKNGQKETIEWKEREVKRHHIVYEACHPWVDGNGRTGRMLMNWERMKLGLPIHTIKADWPNKNGDQMSYYQWFK